ncbi:unnamed protein product [Schistosoma rodhaini]|uniref:Calponin-homology (CH) domain-containing protein n=1 Tax=Schistosoma rodhaini TaxID=6188 RepID=A0AA85G831_9TREM|nr:unnamed protein product [Schistosoma rodhaini]
MSLNFPIENLFEWLRTFNIATNVYSIHNVTDGIVLGKVLHTIAPNHFTDEWLQTLNYDAEINWRLKVSNLKKILKAVIEFLNEGIEDRISVQFLPNLQEIAEHENEESTFRLLQLILACAVNCDNKQTYIQTIMGMEETVQQAIMEAIQQLMSTRLSISDTMDYEDRLCKTVEQYKVLLVEKEKLAEQCKNLQEEVINLQEEKSNQQSELNRFKIYFNSLGLNPAILATTTTTAIIPQSSPTSSIVTTTTGIESMETNLNSINSELLNQSASSSISANPCSNNVLMSPTIANLRINHLQNQLSKLRDELYRTECDKEELKIQLTEVTLQNQELKQKCTILTAKAEESIHLKDELDIAREEASNVLRLTTTIEQLRKHADEAISLRLRCTQLENDNQICIQRLSELEQETRLDGNIRSKVKAQARLQVEDAQFLANEAIKRAELAEENLLKIRQELMNVNREKECIFSELTRLKSCCEGLQSCAQTTNYGTSAIESQMLNLQEELCRLRTSMYVSDVSNSNRMNEVGGDITTMSTANTTTAGKLDNDTGFVDDNDFHRFSMSLTSQQKLNTDDVCNDCNSLPVNDNDSSSTHIVQTSSINSYHIPVDKDMSSSPAAATTTTTTMLYTNLMTKLAQKEADFIEMEQKYRGYLWKAREVIRLLERQYRQHQHDCPQYKEKLMIDTHNSTDTTNSNISNDKLNEEINHLRALLVEKERVIEKLETHHEQMRRHREAEERILLAAWYNLVIKSTKNKIESNLKQNYDGSPEKLSSISCNKENNLSFLTRQRNIHLKPPTDLTSLVMATK